MELNYYQTEAHKTSLHNTPVIYPTLGLTGEAGEVADKVKKVIRESVSNATHSPSLKKNTKGLKKQ